MQTLWLRSFRARISLLATALLVIGAGRPLHAQLPRDVAVVLRDGDSAFKAGARGQAISAYRVVVQRDSSASSRAVYRLAVLLAEDGMYGEAIMLHKLYNALEPNDAGGALGLARTLAWSGNLQASIRLYDSLHTSSVRLEARKGLALVTAWQGDLTGSERLWRSLAAELPNDAEVWTGLAQVLRWRGQPFDARDALLRALSIDPQHRDARSQRRWLDAELAPMIQGRVVSTGDSDDNQAQIYTIEGGTLPWRRVGLRIDATQVTAQLGPQQRVSQTLHGAARVRLPFGADDWTARLELGANRRPNGAAEPLPTRAVWQLGLGGRIGDRSTAEARVGRTVIDETISLIANGIRLTSAEADWGSQVSDHLNISAAVSRGRIDSDSGSNSRIVGLLGARWAMPHGRSFGISARALAHGREARDGYFSPRRYAHLELTARARKGKDLGWVFTGDAGLGAQYADYRGQASTQPTQRLTGSVSYVFAPGLEWTLNGALANVAMAGSNATSGYRFGSLSVAGRVPLR